MLFPKILATHPQWSNYVFAISLLIFFCLKGISQEIVTNGSFETWPITGEWTTIDAGITTTQEIVDFSDGASSCRVTVTTQDQEIMDLRQTVNVFAGVDYTVSVRVFQTDNQARARLYIGGFTGIYSDESTTGVWQELTYNFIPTVSGSTEIGFRFYDVEANWLGGTSDILIDQFSIVPTTGIVADRFEFLQEVPMNAGVNLPFEITLCATNGSSVDITYTNAIILNDLGSTATYNVLPLGATVPTSGCVTYTITPTSTGTVSFDVGNGDFVNLQPNAIPVSQLDIPTVAYSDEVYGSTIADRTSTSALNDVWENLQGDSCRSIAGGTFQPIFGTLSYDTTTHIGTVSGLVDMVNGTSGVPYTGNATFRLVSLNGPLKGTHFTTNGGSLSANTTTMQANSPKPSEISTTLHYTENTGNLTARNAIAFTFDPPISDFGVWVGDMETNPFGTNAEVLLFNGDALLSQTPIITSSSVAEQMNTGGIGCGSSVNYLGCGNQATRWIEFSGALVTDALIVVGDDEMGGQGLSEHLSFGGVTLGGTCSAFVLSSLDWQLETTGQKNGILLNWSSPIPAKVSIEKQAPNGIFSPILVDQGSQTFLDQMPHAGWNTYRLKWQSEDGSTGYSVTKTIFWTGQSAPVIYPNPAKDFLSISWGTEAIRYKIWNYQGQLLNKGELINGKGEVSLNQLSSGRYMCQLFKGGKVEFMSFVVR